MNALHIAQAVISVCIIGLILLQQRGSDGLGSAFGGMTSDAVYRTRRGLERVVFWTTIALAVVFLVLAVISVKFS